MTRSFPMARAGKRSRPPKTALPISAPAIPWVMVSMEWCEFLRLPARLEKFWAKRDQCWWRLRGVAKKWKRRRPAEMDPEKSEGRRRFVDRTEAREYRRGYCLRMRRNRPEIPDCS